MTASSWTLQGGAPPSVVDTMMRRVTYIASWFDRKVLFLMVTCRYAIPWFCCWMFGMSTAAYGQELSESRPLSLHPQNPRYFLWQDRPTFLITSGEHYGALLNQEFDFRAYFDVLAADRLNHTRVFAGTYREIPDSFGITDNPLAPAPHRYLAPWLRSNEPGYVDGGNKFDLRQWNPAYFQRLNDLMNAARAQGIVVELTLFCPFYNDALWLANPMHANNNVNGIGNCPREEVYALQHADLTDMQLAFVSKVVQELQGFDNLYFEICNEPYFGGVTMEWQHRVADTIRAVERELPHQHLISRNVANGRARVEKPHPGISIFNFHYCVPPDAVALNAHLQGVIGENETGFRGRQDVLYRTEAWDFLLAGGGLFNNLDYSFTTSHPRGDLLDYQSPGGGSPTLRRQLRILRDFLEGFDFVAMHPDPEMAQQASSQYTVQVLSEPGRAYAIYVHVPLDIKPNAQALKQLEREVSATLQLSLPPATYRATWVDTKTGSPVKEEALTAGESGVSLQSPAFVADIALRVQRD